MITEVARFTAKPGRETEFGTAIQEGLRVIQRQPVHLRSCLMQGVEHPDQFTLIVEWESLEGKLAFRNGSDFPEWRKPFADLMAGPPESAHWAVLQDTASVPIG